MSTTTYEVPPAIYSKGAPSELFDKFYTRDDQGNIHSKLGYTIVADGDWTLYESSSHASAFNQSPAREPVLQWIRSGIKINEVGKEVFTHQLVLATGGDAKMTAERFIRYLPDDVKPAVTIVTNSGARLFYYDSKKLLQEDSFYSSNCIEGGVCINSEVESAFIHHAVDLLNIFFAELKTNSSLQKEVEAAPYGQWVNQAALQYPEHGFSTQEFKEQKRLLRGIYKTLDSCPRIEIRELTEGQSVQISIVGIFPNLPSLKNHQEFQRCFKKLSECPGVILSQNLAVLEISRTSKGTLLEYLGLNPEYSLGMGDAPDANDKPLSEYVAKTSEGHFKTMPFISVAEAPSKTVKADSFYHIGHKVEGSKAFFEALLVEQQNHPKQDFLKTVEVAQLMAKKHFD